MPSHARPYKRAVCTALAALLGCLGLALVALLSPARAATPGSLQQQISTSQSKVSNLSGAVSAAAGRVNQLDASIGSLRNRMATIQAKLDASLAALAKVRVQYAAAQRKLQRLQAFERHAEDVLTRMLVSNYESDHPDLVSVVLDATGFQNLLERLAFAQRIRRQDVTIVREVKAARRAVALEATRLGALQVREERLTAKIRIERDALVPLERSLVAKLTVADQARAKAAGQLASAKAQLSKLNSQLASQQAQPAISSGNSGVGSPHISFGPISSSGGFVFPMPKGSVTPPSGWSLDNGVDIGAPGGTPEYAVCSGTIVLHGLGGFGQWAPILHCDSPVGGYSYVYYGHAGPANQLPVGTHVSAGQVMSEVGPGIVGISTGPHIEIGFSDASGSLLGPGTAGTMQSLLLSAYNH